jgi:hypothetical protein
MQALLSDLGAEAWARVLDWTKELTDSIDFTTSEIVQECTRLHYQEAKLNIEPKIMPVAGSIGITDPRKHFHNTVKLLLIDLHAIGAGDSKELGGMP